MKGNKLTRSFHGIGFKIKKHSPEILVFAGIAGVVTSTVMACKATTKLSGILEESKGNIDQLHDYVDTNGYSEKYSEEDYKKDLALVYFQSGIKVAKLYAPAVGVGVISISAIIMSNRILSKRNVALAAAYATIDKSFKSYRDRVIERFGKRVDYELKNGIKAKEVEVEEIDEKGNKVTTKKTEYVIDSEPSEYARWFAPGNDNWNDDPYYNLLFLKRQQQYANEKLRIKGYLFLNDVYRSLGLPETKAGQVVGWIYDEDREVDGIDGYVDFGIYDVNVNGYGNDNMCDKISEQRIDFVNGLEVPILLDFNVDGNIWDKM